MVVKKAVDLVDQMVNLQVAMWAEKKDSQLVAWTAGLMAGLSVDPLAELLVALKVDLWVVCLVGELAVEMVAY